jgi:hypothetical protein
LPSCKIDWHANMFYILKILSQHEDAGHSLATIVKTLKHALDLVLKNKSSKFPFNIKFYRNTDLFISWMKITAKSKFKSELSLIIIFPNTFESDVSF